MQFNNTTDKNGLIQMCEKSCGFSDGGISGTSLLLAQFTAMINRAYALVTNWIRNCDNEWKWDDSNYTDFPISATTLVANQHDYSLPTTLLKLRLVEIMDVNGNYYPLSLLSEEDYRRKVENMQEEAGMPTGYYLFGNSIFIYPKTTSEYSTLAAGLRLTYDRYADYFTSADTTQSPGFAEPFHQILGYLASMEYCLDKDMSRYQPLKLAVYEPKIGLKDQLEKHYSSRNKDDVSVITRVRQSFK